MEEGAGKRCSECESLHVKAHPALLVDNLSAKPRELFICPTSSNFESLDYTALEVHEASFSNLIVVLRRFYHCGM